MCNFAHIVHRKKDNKQNRNKLGQNSLKCYRAIMLNAYSSELFVLALHSQYSYKSRRSILLVDIIQYPIFSGSR